MHEKYTLSAALDKLYENQIAIAAAVEELALWVEVRGEDISVADNVRSALETLDRNADVINRTLAHLREEQRLSSLLDAR